MKNTVSRLNKELEQCQRRAQETKTQLMNAARAAENDFNQKITNLKATGEEAAKKHAEELYKLKTGLEKRMTQALQALQTAKDDEIEKLQERLEALQAHLESLVQQHEEAMIRAENEKQQALLIGKNRSMLAIFSFLTLFTFFKSRNIAHRDKQALMEKLEVVARELKVEQEGLERLKREHNARDDKQRNAIAQLKDEISAMRAREEENR